MNRFLNILNGWLAFGCVIILVQTSGALRRRIPDQPMAWEDYVFLGLVVASIFFLDYAVERYLISPHVFTKEQRKELLEVAEAGYRKTFFRGAQGISLFFLVAYVLTHASPAGQRLKEVTLVGGKKVKANESYTLATDDATAAGAGGLTMLAAAPVERVGLLDSEAVAAYLRRLPQPVEVGASSAFQSTRR
jgi:hypothetical protein